LQPQLPLRLLLQLHLQLAVQYLLRVPLLAPLLVALLVLPLLLLVQLRLLLQLPLQLVLQHLLRVPLLAPLLVALLVLLLLLVQLLVLGVPFLQLASDVLVIQRLASEVLHHVRQRLALPLLRDQFVLLLLHAQLRLPLQKPLVAVGFALNASSFHEAQVPPHALAVEHHDVPQLVNV